MTALAELPAGVPPEDDPARDHRIASVRLGLSEALLDRCVDHLAGRDGPDGPLLLHPMLKDALAEARICQLEAAAVLDGPAPSRRLLARVHAVLSDADRTLLRTLGASGYTEAGAGRIAHESELLADAHAPRPGTET